MVKLTIRPIDHHHPWSSSLLHVDTGPTVSSIFGTLPGSPSLSECQALSAIRPVSPQWHQTGVLSASIPFLGIGRSHRVPNQGSTVGRGDDSHFVFQFSSFQCRRWRAAASGQLSGSWAQIWLRHSACPILMSEPVGVSHNQFPPLQQCREWSDVDPDGRALEFVHQFQELCSLWVSLCVRQRQLMYDQSWTRHAIETPAHDSSFGPRRLVESLWGSP